MKERLIQCLRELDIPCTGSLLQLRPLYRLVLDLSPTFKEHHLQRFALNKETRRRREAEQIIDSLREAIEEVLCTKLSSNERVRILERAVYSSTSEGDLAP